MGDRFLVLHLYTNHFHRTLCKYLRHLTTDTHKNRRMIRSNLSVFLPVRDVQLTGNLRYSQSSPYACDMFNINIKDIQNRQKKNDKIGRVNSDDERRAYLFTVFHMLLWHKAFCPPLHIKRIQGIFSKEPHGTTDGEKCGLCLPSGGVPVPPLIISILISVFFCKLTVASVTFTGVRRFRTPRRFTAKHGSIRPAHPRRPLLRSVCLFSLKHGSKCNRQGGTLFS